MTTFKPHQVVDIHIQDAWITEVDDWNNTVTFHYANGETGEIFEATLVTSTSSVTLTEGGESQ